MAKWAAVVACAGLGVMLASLASACGGESNPFGVKSERVTQADGVSAMEFASDGRLFFAQQFTGDIRIIKADGSPQAEPFAHVDPALYLEWGLTGLALDPDFEQNHYVYAYYTQLVSQQEETVTPAPGSTASPSTVQRTIAQPVVIRFTDRNGKGEESKIIIGDLPNTLIDHPGFNANGRIHFGPDGFLYLSLGDYDVQFTAPDHPSQNLTTPVGKLLRVNKEDGSPAPGNPFLDRADADPRIFAYGFREPFDFAFHPQTGKIYGTDNTPVSCEELNIVVAGGNYGWPKVGDFPYPECGVGGQTQAIHYFAREGKQPGDFLSFVEASALAFVSAAKYSTLGDALLVCQLASTTANGPAQPRMRHVVLSGAAFDQVTTDDTVVKDCRLSLAVSPDGTVYYSNDKEIKRLIPPKQ